MTAIDLAKSKSGALFLHSKPFVGINILKNSMAQSITNYVHPPPPPSPQRHFILLIINKSGLGMVASYADVLSLATF